MVIFSSNFVERLQKIEDLNILYLNQLISEIKSLSKDNFDLNLIQTFNLKFTFNSIALCLLVNIFHFDFVPLFYFLKSNFLFPNFLPVLISEICLLIESKSLFFQDVQ